MTEETRLRNEKKFIEKSTEVHKGKYDYSKVDYKNNATKVEIICKEHGSFWQRPNDHKAGYGCPKCVLGNRQLLPLEKVLDQFKEAHGDRYDYSRVDYKNNATKVEIICKEHGSFWQNPNNHKIGNGCPQCTKLPLEKILEQFKEAHGDRYDYSKVDYKGATTKVEIICKEHGSFRQSPDIHKNGSGCPKCYFESKELSTMEIIDQFKEVHGDGYDYSKVDYNGNSTKVEIICKEHGSFWQSPDIHKRGCGCSKCKESKGEKKIREYLESKDINFIQEYSLIISHDDVDYNHRFDFFLPDLDIHIEYDGKQHFEPIEFFGGEEAFENVRFKDNLKDLFCENNNLKMIRIPYIDINRIDEILDGHLS